MVHWFRAIGVTVLLVVGTSACGSTVGASPNESDIVGGQTDTGDPAVVELLESDPSGGQSCTATFISPTVLLTAAHCVASDENPKVLSPGASFRLLMGPFANKAEGKDVVLIELKNVHPHPGYDGDIAHDVAIVVVDKPATVTPVPFLRTKVAPSLFGSSVRLVGYGQNVRKSGPNDGAETKRSVVTILVGATDGLLHIGRTGAQACDGDSGGPALLAINGVETIVGLDDVAFKDKKNCQQGDLYQPLDANLDFIDSFLAAGTARKP